MTRFKASGFPLHSYGPWQKAIQRTQSHDLQTGATY